MGPDKNILCIKLNIFLSVSLNICFGTQRNCLNEMVLVKFFFHKAHLSGRLNVCEKNCSDNIFMSLFNALCIYIICFLLILLSKFSYGFYNSSLCSS